MSSDHELKSYVYELASDRIAQTPEDRREESRLLVLDKADGSIRTDRFSNLGKYLPGRSLLVGNNSKVIPARLLGRKPSGGRVELLPLTPLPVIQRTRTENGQGWSAEIECLLKASKGPRVGERIEFPSGLSAEVLERGEFGRSRVALSWKGDLLSAIREFGKVPLPPYIKREAGKEDLDRYQTVYAKEDKAGSIAAPTAGLHFSKDLRQELLSAGHPWAEVTLHVGYGTFSPVRCEDIREHRMHEEYIEISGQTAQDLKDAKDGGRAVVALGTTSVRTLEGAYQAAGEIGPFQGLTDIYIRPGYEFRIADHLVTNFHLPGSSLLIMVSALAGRKAVLNAYEHAIREGFRFFSYGDAMLIL